MKPNDLINKYTPLVKKIAKYYAGNFLTVEDLTQDGYIGLLKANSKYNWNDREDKFQYYAIPYIRGAMLNDIKKQVIKHQDILSLDMIENVANLIIGDKDVNSSINTHIILDNIAKIIFKLPKLEQDIVRLKLQGMTFKEIGKRYSLATVDVSNRYYQAIEDIRKEI